MAEKENQVVMPKLGLTMSEATLVEWLKQEGDLVQKGELLFTIESEKATLEIEAPCGGTLQILVPAGETVPVMTPVARLEGGAAVSEPEDGARVKASPKARALARRRGLSLRGLKGSGPRDMIVSADLVNAKPLEEVEAQEAEPVKASPVARRVAAEAGIDLAEVAGTGPQGRVTRADVERIAPCEGASRKIEALTGLRRVIAERLSEGWRERPQVTLTTEADATNLVMLRRQLIEEMGEKISYDAILVMLVARALGEHPYMNAMLTEKGIEQMTRVNIGVAVDTERGLLVPVVRDAGAQKLSAINRRLREMTERALEGTSTPDELTGGTFTITNLGMFGIDAFTPIINPPECAVLGVGRIVSRPVGLDGQIVLREMMALSLSFDHRLVDGAPAARFLYRVRTLIERPFILAFLD